MYRTGQEEINEVTKVLQSRQWFRYGDPATGHLQEVDRFEAEWAEMMGTQYAILHCGGGTAALACCLAGVGIGPGDEVIVPAYTWMATATSVLTVGAIPVLADVDETLGLDPDDFERRIGPHTRAVIPVHMAGRPANMDRILAVARKHNIRVIEDSCQMNGGTYHGKRTGTLGDAGAYSFNFFKIISAGGEGGCVVTNDRKIYETAFAYHDSGTSFRPRACEFSIPVFVAQQYRADEVTGAIARMQMQKLDAIIRDLRKNQKRLASALTGDAKKLLAPGNDPDGDCGVMLTLRFKDEAVARKFATAPGVEGKVVIDTGKHVYTQWEPLRLKRISHHPDMNPFNFARNQGLRADYSDAVCLKTLAILRRTVYVPVNPDLTEAAIAGKCAALAAAAKSL